MLVLGQDSSRSYWKELIYEGSFLNLGGDGKKFVVDESVIDHWQNTGTKMLSNGIDIPVPIEHTEDPEKNRGFVREFAKGVKTLKDGKQVRTLLGRIQFVNADAEKLAFSTDVSIYVPDKAEDGLGNKYKNPVRHVALTSYPVIPGLAPFKAIVASIKLGDNQMLAELAKKLGIEIEDGMDDAAIAEKITMFVTALKSKAEGSGDKPAPSEPAMSQEGVPAQATAAAAAAPATSAQGGTISTTFKLPSGVAASMCGMLKDSRTSKIDALVNAGNITKATADALKQSHCSDAALRLSLTETGEIENKEFDALCAALAKNQAVNMGERSGPQSVRLSNPGSSAENTLLANAERRAKARAS